MLRNRAVQTAISRIVERFRPIGKPLVRPRQDQIAAGARMRSGAATKVQMGVANA